MFGDTQRYYDKKLSWISYHIYTTIVNSHMSVNFIMKNFHGYTKICENHKIFYLKNFTIAIW